MIGIDVTHLAVATEPVRTAIAGIGTPPARAVGAMLDFYGESYVREQGFSAPPVHDPVAVAALIDPSVITCRSAPLTVELTGTATLGMTVADLRSWAQPDCTTRVAVGLDADRFWDLVIDALRRIG